MPADLITRIAGESKGRKTMREQLNKELSILTEGSETCKRFVRSKTDEGSFDSLLVEGYLKRESSCGSIYEVTSDMEDPDYSDSSSEGMVAPEALSEIGDDTVPTCPEEECKLSIRSRKKANKKKRN
ncbi:hypothetical protein BDV59DRAFT_119926 [Aspergillus ambiguus]|uniref:uncharacterized protein n=1 Tax=Aspergillus ambiguus TaxID=176160 RepID=UPI003CCD9B56